MVSFNKNVFSFPLPEEFCGLEDGVDQEEYNHYCHQIKTENKLFAVWIMLSQGSEQSNE